MRAFTVTSTRGLGVGRWTGFARIGSGRGGRFSGLGGIMAIAARCRWEVMCCCGGSSEVFELLRFRGAGKEEF